MNGYRALHKLLRLSSELGLTHEEVRSTVGKMREMSSEVLYHASRSGLQDRFSRRDFFYGSLLAGAVPAAGFGSPASLKRLGYKSPNEKLNIDAVIVSTPDRMHATAATWSMERRKHLYCQKPLTRTNREARALAKAAAKYKVATQMGNHGYSNDGSRQCAEMFRTNSPYGDGLASERIADLICSFFAADTFSLSREA
jgi:hypothetical protein